MVIISVMTAVPAAAYAAHVKRAELGWLGIVVAGTMAGTLATSSVNCLLAGEPARRASPACAETSASHDASPGSPIGGEIEDGEEVSAVHDSSAR